jgi:hypothetical protein
MQTEPTTAAINTLTQFVEQKIAECPLDQQIKLYSAIAEVTPSADDRERSLQISKLLSQAAALQLNFQPELFTKGKP